MTTVQFKKLAKGTEFRVEENGIIYTKVETTWARPGCCPNHNSEGQGGSDALFAPRQKCILLAPEEETGPPLEQLLVKSQIPTTKQLLQAPKPMSNQIIDKIFEPVKLEPTANPEFPLDFLKNEPILEEEEDSGESDEEYNALDHLERPENRE